MGKRNKIKNRFGVCQEFREDLSVLNAIFRRLNRFSWFGLVLWILVFQGSMLDTRLLCYVLLYILKFLKHEVSLRGFC